MLALISLDRDVRGARAAGITVNSLGDGGSGDGQCTLREAIMNANANAALESDCASGVGADVVTSSVSGTITLASSLPAITDPAGLSVDATGQSVVVRGGTAGEHQWVVSSGATLFLTGLTLDVVTPWVPLGPGVPKGIRNEGGTLSVIRSTLQNFVSPIVNEPGGTLTVVESTVRRGISGGLANRGTATILRSTFTGNSAGQPCHSFCGAFGSGGGIGNSGLLLVANSTISGNFAGQISGHGGGVWNTTLGVLTLMNSTVTNNVVNDRLPGTSLGGGIYTEGSATLINSLLAGNTGGVAPDCSGAITATGPNLIGSNAGCNVTGIRPIAGSPVLGPLADNGGPTQTHELLGGLAVDAGNDAICATGPVNGVDQRGVVRPNGPHCDLGSFEAQIASGTPFTSGDFETGGTGWTFTGLLDGIARVETEGACFGANNTIGITFAGTQALNVRSSPGAPHGSTGIATASPFTLGSALRFRALVENDDAAPAPYPVSLELRLLDNDGGVLGGYPVEPRILTTSPGTSADGCLVGDLRNGDWSSHIVDTPKLAGMTARLEFRQHTNVPGKGFFALIDDVTVVPSPPSPLLR